MIYYLIDVMDDRENDELANATLVLSREYNGKKLNENVRYGIASSKLEQYRSGKGAEETWLSGKDSPQNSWNMVDVQYPDIVKKLSDRMTDAVDQISKGLKMKKDIKPIEIWYNVYDNTQYQEPHNHNPSIFSAVYFSKLPDGSSILKFNDGVVKQKERCGVVFLSHMNHGVEIGTNIEPRITWSMNFK